MKLLLIAPYPVFPTTAGGKIRVVRLARKLAERGAAVTLLTPFHFTQQKRLFQDEPFLLRQVPYPFLQSLLTDNPFPYSYLTSFHPGLAAMARPLFAGFDAYQFEHAQFADLAAIVPPDAPVFYDAHNVEYDYGQFECRKPWASKTAGRRLYLKESRLLHRAAHTFAVCEGDLNRFVQLYGADRSRISVAPNGIPAAAERPKPDPDRVARRFPDLRKYPRRALYSGSDVAHNRDAVRFILHDLVPAAPPDHAFVIHGTCGRSFRGYSSRRVFFDPEESGFGDYYSPATVGLNPVSGGSGTNLKLLHYWSHGLPVISTAFGMRGYHDLAHHARVCDLPQFAAALGDGQFPPPPGREDLEARYAWASVAGHMWDTYQRVLGETGRRPAAPSR